MSSDPKDCMNAQKKKNLPRLETCFSRQNNTAEKALLNAEKISKALKESTEKTLKSIVNEAFTTLN